MLKHNVTRTLRLEHLPWKPQVGDLVYYEAGADPGSGLIGMREVCIIAATHKDRQITLLNRFVAGLTYGPLPLDSVYWIPTETQLREELERRYHLIHLNSAIMDGNNTYASRKRYICILADKKNARIEFQADTAEDAYAKAVLYLLRMEASPVPEKA